MPSNYNVPAFSGISSAYRHLFAIAVIVLVIWPLPVSAFGDQELEREASWSPLSSEQLEAWIREWSQLAKVNPDTNLKNLDSRINQHPDSTLGVCLNLIVECFPFTAGPVAMLSAQPQPGMDDPMMAATQLLQDPRLPESAKFQLQLAFGAWFTRHQRYDEAIEVFADLETDQVVAADALLFYRGLAEHRLLKTDSCPVTLKRLLENEDQIPRRFAVVSKLMIADIEALESDSLNEISRLMEDIKRRQALHRSGKRVIEQEKKVIDKLDQMIEDLEKQMQQSQASSSSSQDSSEAMPESQNAGGKGSGEAADRQLADGGAWGNVPPKKRAAVLAEMAKELPPHYREVIEEYFRQLAKQPKK
ncbi:MAG: hypothetical protein GY743_13765 [Planctomycetaceae bacterium]|nr:hypothetical protein [Planctomycetaceae bacterium]